MTCREHIDTLFEAYDQELAYLARALQPSDEDKQREAAHEMAHDLDRWIDQLDEPLEGFTVSEDEPWESVNELESKYPEAFKEFGEWALDRMERSNSSEVPPWMNMGFEKIVRNDWLIHFSDEAHSVHSQGFTRGVETHDYNRLSLSTHFSKKRGGFNFAYPTDINVDRYARGGRSWSHNEYKYGKDAVMFQANGVRVHHYGDEEPQVIYVGKSAHNLVYLQNVEGTWCVGESFGTDRYLYKSEKLDDVIEWVKANYDQYHKSLRARRENPTAKPYKHTPSVYRAK